MTFVPSFETLLQRKRLNSTQTFGFQPFREVVWFNVSGFFYILFQLKVDKASEHNKVLRAKQNELKAFNIYLKAKLARASLQEKFGHAIG